MYVANVEFWKDAAERALKTAAQAALAMIGSNATGILAVDWAQIGSVAALAAVISLLTSLASDRIGPPGPSLVKPAAVEPAQPQPFVYPVTGPDANMPPGIAPIDYRP
jgi:hypothetical protein